MRCESSDSWEEIAYRGQATAKTVVLVGKTGNGKSATGNSIIGRRVFDSKASFGGVTSTCQFETAVLHDGQIINVIDTPGLFDSAVESHVMASEIAKCINMAKDGIHALLLILSIGSRFTEEEASAFKSLCQIFGAKIADYMIVVFSRGDNLGNTECLDDFIGPECPKILMNTLEMCGNRVVVFDNKTENDVKKWRQRMELLSLVQCVVKNNHGNPFTNDLFEEFKKEEMNLINQSAEGASSEGNLIASNKEQFDRFIEMVEKRLQESVENLEKQLSEERAARMEAEMKALELQAKSKDAADQLRESLNRADESRRQLEERLHNELNESLKRAEESRKHLEERLHHAENKFHCVIM